MRFSVAPEVFDRFPGIHIAVVIARGLNNQIAPPEVVEQWRAAWQEAGQTGTQYGNAQSHPRIRPWRYRFQTMGVSGKQFPSSAEALLRRALKGGEPFSINALVDFYNAVSLRYSVPVGAFDLGDIHGPLELRLTRDGDTFTALGDDEVINVPAGEVAYTDGSTIITRHFVWRQSRAGLITQETRDAFLVSEILGEVGEDIAQLVLSDLNAGAQSLFGATTQPFLVSAENPSIEWADAQ